MTMLTMTYLLVAVALRCSKLMRSTAFGGKHFSLLAVRSCSTVWVCVMTEWEPLFSTRSHNIQKVKEIKPKIKKDSEIYMET